MVQFFKVLLAKLLFHLPDDSIVSWNCAWNLCVS